MIKAVIFDMDGLLIDSEPLWLRAHHKVFREIGVSYTDEEHSSTVGIRTSEVLKLVYEQKPWKGTSLEQTEAMITDEVIRLIKREGKMMPGVNKALSICEKTGLPIALASSSASRVIDAVVDKLKLRQRFDYTYSAEFEKRGKPQPDIFLSVAKHLGVSPSDCLVFEDSPAGVQAAKAAGMICITVPESWNRNNKSVKTADAVLVSLEEFNKKLLERLG